jgi:uncharacterized cupin superfamily protein
LNARAAVETTFCICQYGLDGSIGGGLESAQGRTAMTSASIWRFEPNGPVKSGLTRWPDMAAIDLESGVPVQHGHEYLKDSERGLTAGVWDCTAFTSTMMSYPVNEFMILLEGEVTIIEENGRRTTVRAGESFILPKGLRCKWQQTGNVRKYFVIFDDASGLSPQNVAALEVRRPDPRGDLAPSAPPAADLLLSAVPRQRAHVWFEDLTGQWTVGVWATTPYHRKAVPFPRHELMHILEGSVTLTDGAGMAHRFHAGDTFFVPMGTACDWECTQDLRKIYCIFQPKAVAAKSQAAE